VEDDPLKADVGVFEDYDLIIPSPTYVGEGGRDSDHTGDIIERAKVEGRQWPFRTDVMEKTRATPRLAKQTSFMQRAHVAETQIGPALRVTRPGLVDGASVLVFDDVFTGGLTLRETAFKLRAAGAVQVSGIVLARQPFRS